ncbi:MAG: hypothetical protein IE931_03445 [Sphingobacteriales bacterium]|nr:hypothetical protein [Sphingobacteriales bacterium]
MPFFNVKASLDQIVYEINENLYIYSISDLFDAANAEREHQNRKAVLLAINQAVRTQSDLKLPFLDADKLRKKANALLKVAKKKFVKRMYQKHGLFALDEIIKRYPNYDEEQIALDLIENPKKRIRKSKKYVPYTDARRVQIQKLGSQFRFADFKENEKEYHRACTTIAILQNALNRKEPIPLLVNLQQSSKVYYFKWNANYDLVKSFIKMANVKGKTHEDLQSAFKMANAIDNV